MTPPSSPPSQPTGSPLYTPTALDSLADALAAERMVVDELIVVLLRQRAAVGANDTLAIDDSIFDIHRILLTLSEVRKRRHTISDLLGCAENLHLKDLSSTLGEYMTSSLQTEIEALQDSTRQLARDTDVNRRILNAAVANSESLVRLICGVDENASPTYTTGATSHAPLGAPVFTRTV